MGDASLSQDEIDALLMGADEVDEFAPAATGMESAAGTDMNTGMGSGASLPGLRAAMEDAMATASSAATSLVTSKTVISNAQIRPTDTGAASAEVSPGAVLININMGTAKAAMVIQESAARKISMTMMGSDSEPAELDEAYLSTLGELANTLLSSVSNNLGQRVNDNLSPSPPETIVYSGGSDFPGFAGGVVKASFDMSVENIGVSKLDLYIDAASAERWEGALSMGSGAAFAAPQQQAPVQQQAAPQQQPGGDMGGFFGGPGGMGQQQAASVNPVNFPSLTSGGMVGQQQMPSNIDLLMDVMMVMTVELGRTKKYVKDILGLGEGSIIELDKLAGEPVDLLVNGKLIAKGEVVVIDENFGVRVTDIVGPSERLARLTQ